MCISGSWASSSDGHTCLHDHRLQAHRNPGHPFPDVHAGVCTLWTSTHMLTCIKPGALKLMGQGSADHAGWPCRDSLLQRKPAAALAATNRGLGITQPTPGQVGDQQCRPSLVWLQQKPIQGWGKVHNTGLNDGHFTTAANASCKAPALVW